MSWGVLLALSAISYALKATGPVLAGGRELGPAARRILDLVSVPLLAALVLVQTAGDGHRLVFDGRAPAQSIPGEWQNAAECSYHPPELKGQSTDVLDSADCSLADMLY